MEHQNVSFYLGGYAQPGEAGIRAFSFDPRTGGCALLAEHDLLRNPAYLLCHPQRPVLYAVEELQPEGSIVALARDGLELRRLRAFPSGGADPCHLSLSPDGSFLFAANYTGGSLTVLALDEEGLPVRVSDFVRHAAREQDMKGANPVRQESAHAHFSLCDGTHVFVADLGLNTVFVYGWDAARGKLVDQGERISFPDGAGPRHLAVSEYSRHLYVLCELTAQVHVFAREGGGAWQRVQVVSTVPEDFTQFADYAYSIGAAIRIVNGDKLYVSNRGHNSMAAFHISPDGRLSDRHIFASEGKTPRDFQVIGDCLIAANQDSGSLAVFRQDVKTGEHRLIGQTLHVGSPSCLCVTPEMI